MRAARLVPVLVTALAASALVAAGPAEAATAPVGAPPAAAPAAAPVAAARATAAPVRVGSLALRPCHVVARAPCGTLSRPWDPTGAVPGRLSVGFAFVPARDRARPALGTYVPREGGPGYATTASGSAYAAMYGPLLRRHNLLLVDQRGTGRSAPIDCPGLQNLTTGAYAPAAAACAASLGARAHLYGTALSADDLAAVIRALHLGRVDVYGDSYGSFFAQVFAGRHPGLVRSLVVDGAYPAYGENAWYPTQGPAMRRSFNSVCRQSPSCASRGGSTIARLEQVLARVRTHPVTGRAPGADGSRHRVTLDGASLVYVAFNATYVPTTYRELDAALRAMLAGRPAALLRLLAEADFPGGGVDAPADYSEGADVAVSCQDYPQLYDMQATPAIRRQQYAAAVAARERSHPKTYGPFTIGEYLASDWEEQDWCLSWPAAPPPYQQGPPRPPAGSYSARIPVLVLSGALDSITTPAEGAIVARQWPRSRQIVVANSFHVTALDDTDGCAVSILRRFLPHPGRALPAAVTGCARTVPPVRPTPAFPARLEHEPPATALPGGTTSRIRLRAVTTAAETVADVVDRWYQTYASNGLGLRGGTFRIRGSDPVLFTLHRVRLVGDLALTGTIRWDQYAHTVSVDLRLRGRSKVSGHLTGGWDSRAKGALARLTGRLGGQVVLARLPAP